MPPLQVHVVTNSFVVKSLPKLTFYQYQPFDEAQVKDLKPQKRQRLVHNMQVNYPATFTSRVLYDGGALLYTSIELPDTIFRVHGSNQSAKPDAPGWYNLRLSRTTGVRIGPQQFNSVLSGRTSSESATAATILQLLLCQTQNQDQPANNKAYFFEQGKMRIPRMPVELWHGYHQAVRPSPGRVLVTVDTTVAAMYMAGPLMDVAMLVLGANDARRLGPTTEQHPDFVALQKFFKNKHITIKTSGNRIKTVRAFVPGPVGDFEFQSMGTGPTTTIGAHYRKAHNIPLQYPRTVGVVTSGKSAPFKVVIPLELCSMVPGQPYKKKLPPDAGSTRLAKITGGAHGVSSPVQTYANSEFLAEAGVTVPPLVYNSNKIVAPRDGAWNVLNSKFHTPANITKWGLVNLVPGLPFPRVQSIMQQLATCCINLEVTPPPAGSIVQGNTGSVKKSIQEVCAALGGDPDLIIVILPASADELRTEVKFVGDVLLGVRTQCLRQSKLPQDGPKASQYCFWHSVSQSLTCCRLNARMGGRNALVGAPIMKELSKSPFMIFGADVAHPGQGMARPSVASLATRVQPARMEIIAALKQLVKEAIVMFGTKHKVSPARIFFYRDGVSEGEFEVVRAEEVAAIKAAIDELWAERKIASPKPKLTFLVVGKRHHVSFFPSQQDRQVGDRTGNCRAGLVVDRDLQNPQFKDFYLQSHAAIKGSQLQELSFALCHIYAKATRSVSIPAPVYYADVRGPSAVFTNLSLLVLQLACARGKFHIDPNSHLDLDGSTTTGGAENLDMDKWNQAWGNIHQKYKDGMYFL
ncbi:ribonuclease H-like domain-containing protein [Mycena amicta]|nr:ribonuclease H-like domain-containing protein [Mycena amicta]